MWDSRLLEDYSLKNYENPTDNYTPSAHSKFGSTLTAGEFEFNESYISQLAVPLIVFFFLGCGMLVGLCVAQHKQIAKKYQISNSQYWFKLLTMVMFVLAHMVFIGYAFLEEGTAKLQDNIDGTILEMNILVDQNEIMISQRKLMSLLCPPKSNCDASIKGRIEDFRYATERFDNDIGTVPDYLADTFQVIQSFVILPAKMFLFAIYILLLLSFALNTMFVMSKQSAARSKCCGSCVYLTGHVSCVFFLLWTVILGDVCVENPTVEVLESSEEGTLLRSYLTWYSSCYSGYNRLLLYTDISYNQNSIINSTIAENDSLSGSVPYEELLDIALENMDLLTFLKESVRDSCPPVQRYWLDSMNSVLCDDYASGLFALWLVQLLACVCMLALLFLTPVIERKHDKFKKVLPVSPEDASSTATDGHSVRREVRVKGIKTKRATSSDGLLMSEVARNDLAEDEEAFDRLTTEYY